MATKNVCLKLIIVKAVWNYKVPSIKWKIDKLVYGKKTSSSCKLRLKEKLFILNA